MSFARRISVSVNVDDGFSFFISVSRIEAFNGACSIQNVAPDGSTFGVDLRLMEAVVVVGVELMGAPDTMNDAKFGNCDITTVSEEHQALHCILRVYGYRFG